MNWCNEHLNDSLFIMRNNNTTLRNVKSLNLDRFSPLFLSSWGISHKYRPSTPLAYPALATDVPEASGSVRGRALSRHGTHGRLTALECLKENLGPLVSVKLRFMLNLFVLYFSEGVIGRYIHVLTLRVFMLQRGKL